MTFDANAYRKGVLAPIEARGGLPASDPFEWYDLPLSEKLNDATVRAQVDAVWAFWQKQREAPKYRGLILALLARHEEVAALLWRKDTRRSLAEQVRRERTERAADRFAELDAAVGRLVERFGGIPTSKVDGLIAFAAERSISETDARLRFGAHPLVADQARTEAVDPYRRARADLEELGRLLEGAPCPSLFVLLDLPPTAGRREILQARDRVAARNRELLPDRRRALVDDLLAAVTNLLVDGDPETYLSALAVDVAEALRPRFHAAVLVEDLLTPEDAVYLVAEAEALGVDAGRARDVVVSLARDAGVAMPATARRPDPVQAVPSVSSVPEGYQRRPKQPVPASAWHEELSAARAALRAGRAGEAGRHVEAARSLAGGTTPPVRAVSDEVEAVLAEATGLWKAVELQLAARALTELLSTLERLQAIASDIPSPSGRLAADLLAQTQPAASALADATAHAQALPDEPRERELLALWEQHPDDPVVRQALRSLGVRPPSDLQVTAGRDSVRLVWRPSPCLGRVEYRVVVVFPDGGRRVLGTTSECALEAALPGPGSPLPSYAVLARRAGVASEEVISGPPQAQAPDVLLLPVGTHPPQPVTDLARSGELLTWTWPHGVTEVLLVWRTDAPPAGPDDPVAQRRKVTNTRYELDGGAAAPAGTDVHLSVFSCTRVDGTLRTARESAAGLRWRSVE